MLTWNGDDSTKGYTYTNCSNYSTATHLTCVRASHPNSSVNWGSGIPALSFSCSHAHHVTVHWEIPQFLILWSLWWVWIFGQERMHGPHAGRDWLGDRERQWCHVNVLWLLSSDDNVRHREPHQWSYQDCSSRSSCRIKDVLFALPLSLLEVWHWNVYKRDLAKLCWKVAEICSKRDWKPLQGNLKTIGISY